MSIWPRLELGEVVEINPRQPKGIPEAQAVSFVPMAAVNEAQGKIVDRQVREFATVSKGFTTFADGDVLFAKITPCMENGKAAIARDLVNGIGAGSTEFYVLRPGQRILPEFLFHFVRRQSFREACKSHFAGSGGQQRVPRPYLQKVALPVPPLEEQRRIVSVLNRADEIKRRADAARTKARAINSALFLDLFGDPGTNPKGWQPVRLQEVIDRIVGGKNVEAGNGSSPYRILKVSAVTSGQFQPRESKPAPDGYQPPPEHYVRKGDFLFSRANTSALVGAVALVEDDPVGLLLPDKIWRIKWRRTVVEPRFAYSLLRTSAIRRTFSKIASGTSDSMKNISQAKLIRIEVPMPPLSLQTAFAEQIGHVESVASRLDAAAVKAKAMAAAMSAEVFG